MASGKTEKQKHEEIRRSIARKYNEQLDNLTRENKSLTKEIEELRELTNKQEAQIREMQDWVERLQEFVNMEPEEFKKYMEDHKLRANVDKSMQDMFKLFGIMSKSFPFNHF